MGQVLSREDDDERQYEDEQHEHAEEQAEVKAEVKEKPKRRRNPVAVRSRKPRATTQGRTRRVRAFEMRDY